MNAHEYVDKENMRPVGRVKVYPSAHSKEETLGTISRWFDRSFLVVAEEQAGSAKLKGPYKAMTFALCALGSYTGRPLGTKSPPTRPWCLYSQNEGSYYYLVEP